MHKVRVIFYSVIASVICIVVSVAGTYGAFWSLTASEETERLEAEAKTALARVNRTFFTSEELLNAYAVLDVPLCSAKHIDIMRMGILEHPEIEEIGFIQNGHQVCSSWGVAKTFIAEKSPDFVTSSSMQVSVGVKPEYGQHSTRIVLQYGMYEALLNPALFHDPIDDKDQQLSVLTNTGVILTTVNNPDTNLLTSLVKNSTGRFHQGRLFAVVRGGDLVAITSESSETFLQKVKDLHSTILTIGGIISAILIAGIIWYTRKRLSPVSLLAKAVENKEFIVHYQPIMNLATGQCVGAEALVRWQKPDGKMVRPDLFIPLAERSGLILPITDQIIDIVAREMADFLAQYPHTHIAINISAQDMKTGRVLSVMNKALQHSGIKQTQIWLEATERGLMDIKAAKIVIENARNSGYRIAIDDFGTGYSSLSHLQGLPLDTLKMDKSFVDTINAEKNKESITDHIIAMARTLKMTIVAEGIENPEQASYLGALNVEYGQGWLYSKALPAAEFIAFCENSLREASENEKTKNQTNDAFA